MSAPLGGVDARDLLYYDCWVKVFHNLEQEDYPNVSNVCQLFNQILNNSYYGFSELKWKFELVLPLLIPYLDNEFENLTLKSRLVCKTWLDSTDRIFEERECLPCLEAETIGEFMTKFENSNPSPVLLRRVCLQRYPWAANPAFEPRAMLFTQMFGANIWKLEVSDAALLQLLPFTPNLKSFEYSHYRYHNDIDPVLGDLPDLPGLKRLKVHFGNQVAINHLLQRYGPQLESLKYHYFHGWVLGRMGFTDLSLEVNGINCQAFGGLKTLDIEIGEVGANTYAAFQSLDCPLETLRITIRRATYVHLKSDLFLKSIRHLQRIQTLAITADRSFQLSETGELPSEEFSNTSITHLELNVNFGWTNVKACISFNILEFLRLESLTLNFTLDYGGEGKVRHPKGLEKSVDFFDGVPLRDVWNRNKPHLAKELAYESNVWDKVESLEKLELNIKRVSGWKFFWFSRDERDAYYWNLEA